jgi:hypothetical protein
MSNSKRARSREELLIVKEAIITASSERFMRNTCIVYVVYLQRQETRAPVNKDIELQLGEVNASCEERLATSDLLRRDAFCASSNIVGDYGHMGRGDVGTDR